MSLFASVLAVTLASSTLGAPLGLGTEDSRALYGAYTAALNEGFQAMGPSMKRVLATYCQDGQSINGYCNLAAQGAIIGSHLGGNYEDVIRYGDRYAGAMRAYLRSAQQPSGACMVVGVAVMDPRTNSISASWTGHVVSLTYLAQARLKRQAPGAYYQALYCARRAANELFETYDPGHSGVQASEAEARVGRKFEEDILRPFRAASEQLHAELLRAIDKDKTALNRNLLQMSVLYRNAYSACSKARFPANLCGYLSADSIEAEYYERL